MAPTAGPPASPAASAPPERCGISMIRTPTKPITTAL
jgi:hypothetical protein